MSLELFPCGAADSSAARGVLSRLGTGKLRHLELTPLGAGSGGTGRS